MAHPPETKAQLRRHYVHDRLPLETAAERLGIGEATGRRWKAAALKDGDDWDRARSALRLSADGLMGVIAPLVEDYVTLHEATMKDVLEAEAPPLAKAKALSMLADAFTKTMSAAGKASPQLSRLGISAELLKRLAAFVSERYPAAAPALLEALGPFAEQLSREWK